MALADMFDDIPTVIVGNIKIGRGVAAQGANGSYRRPEKLDHFIITTLHREENGDFRQDKELMDSLEQFHDKDGKIRQLPIMFGSDDPDEVMTSHYVWYVGKRLGARADGQTVTFFADQKTGQPLAAPHVQPWNKAMLALRDPKDAKRPLFKRYSTLNVMIASGAARYGGYYKFRTTSEISARQLYGSLSLLHKAAGYVLRGSVFRLVVRPMQVQPDGKATTVHVVHVEYVSNDLKSLQAAARLQLEEDQRNLAALRANREAYKALVAAPAEPEPPEMEDEAETQEEWEAKLFEAVTRAIADAKTLQALGETWAVVAKDVKQLPAEKQAPLIAAKDARKAALSPAAPPAPASPPPPPSNFVPSEKAELIATDKKEFLSLFNASDLGWPGAIAALNAALGCTVHPAATFESLTPQQRGWLADHFLDAEAAKGGK